MAVVPSASGSRVQPGVTTRRAGGAGQAPVVNARIATPQLDTPQLRGGQARTMQIDPNVRAERRLVDARDGSADLIRGGAALAQAGGVASQIALDMQATVNKTVVDAAVNSAKEMQLRLTYDPEAGYTRLKGYDAINRENEGGLLGEYTSQFDEQIATLTGGLKNDAQKQAFSAAAADMRLQFENGLVQYGTREFREYSVSVQRGTISTAIDTLQRNYTEPDVIAREQERIKAGVAQLGMLNGQSAAEIEANTRTALSKGHTVVVQAAINDGNIGYADAYLDRYAESMEADDLLTLKATVTKEVDTQVALGVAQAAMGSIAPAMVPTDMDRLGNIALETVVLSLEGGGTLDNPKTSPKGARGPMQVMPGTNRDPGFGVRPARDDSEAERARVGRDYLAAMVKRYKGDAALALAAYNAGPGRVDEALEKAAKSGGNWLQHCPPETRNYVANGVRKLGTPSGGAPAKPTLDDALAAVRADPRVNRSPNRLKIAEQEVVRQYELSQRSLKAQEDDIVGQAFAMIDQTGSYDALPANMRQRIPGDKIPALRNYAESRTKGNEPETNWSVYYGLKTNPKLLAATNLLAIRNQLGEAEFKELTNAQAAASKNPEQEESQVRTQTQILNQYLSEAGIDPSPKEGSAEAKVVGRVWSMYTSRVRAMEAQKGAKLSPAEQEQAAAGLFATVQVGRGMARGKAVPFVLADPDKVIVPDAERQQIIAALNRSGLPVTEQAILRAYFVGVTSRGGQGGGR